MVAKLLIDKIADVLLAEGTVVADTLAGFPAASADNLNKFGIARNAPDKGLYYSTGTAWLRVPSSSDEAPLSLAATAMRIQAGGAEVVEGLSTGWAVQKFSDGALNPVLIGTVYIPSAWTQVRMHVVWAPDAATAGSVRWLGGIGRAAGVLANPSGVMGGNYVSPGVANTVSSADMGTLAVTGGAIHAVEISRNNANAGDTYTGVASMIGVTLTRTA